MNLTGSFKSPRSNECSYLAKINFKEVLLENFNTGNYLKISMNLANSFILILKDT